MSVLITEILKRDFAETRQFCQQFVNEQRAKGEGQRVKRGNEPLYSLPFALCSLPFALFLIHLHRHGCRT
jgi:hypothetical protein